MKWFTVLLVSLMMLVFCPVGYAQEEETPVVDGTNVLNVLPMLLDDATVGTFYDFESEQLLGGAFTSAVTLYKVVNLDVGCLTDGTGAIPMAGLSVSLEEVVELSTDVEWNLPIPLKAGTFCGYDFADEEVLWGVYAGLFIELEW